MLFSDLCHMIYVQLLSDEIFKEKLRELQFIKDLQKYGLKSNFLKISKVDILKSTDAESEKSDHSFMN